MNEPHARLGIAPPGHGVVQVTLDLSPGGARLSECAWATCICTEPFMGANHEDLARQVLAHYREVASSP